MDAAKYMREEALSASVSAQSISSRKGRKELRWTPRSSNKSRNTTLKKASPVNISAESSPSSKGPKRLENTARANSSSSRNIALPKAPPSKTLPPLRSSPDISQYEALAEKLAAEKATDERDAAKAAEDKAAARTKTAFEKIAQEDALAAKAAAERAEVEQEVSTDTANMVHQQPMETEIVDIAKHPIAQTGFVRPIEKIKEWTAMRNAVMFDMKNSSLKVDPRFPAEVQKTVAKLSYDGDSIIGKPLDFHIHIETQWMLDWAQAYLPTFLFNLLFNKPKREAVRKNLTAIFGFDTENDTFMNQTRTKAVNTRDYVKGKIRGKHSFWNNTMRKIDKAMNSWGGTIHIHMR
eukprot:gnl/TRDRNA2_/TRDRNA2_168813_c0_seq9.p1 gnl/TRDRNA2_/TRDRNA2_168813_c0~~gnl/TRDRNA2_/TRDRNA2_168813_c0_seq9.p1  ORF type:complete len:360 (+),score=71.26 gnl/TRDRNA2_/TRDRNA2_168813_c0_seq9:33-1082(+)